MKDYPKTCAICGNNFIAHNWRAKYCPECVPIAHAEFARTYYKNNREKYSIIRKRYEEKHRDEIKIRRHKYYMEHRDEIKIRRIKKELSK